MRFVRWAFLAIVVGFIVAAFIITARTPSMVVYDNHNQMIHSSVLTYGTFATAPGVTVTIAPTKDNVKVTFMKGEEKDERVIPRTNIGEAELISDFGGKVVLKFP